MSHMAQMQNMFDFPPAPKLTVTGRLDPAKATAGELAGERLCRIDRVTAAGVRFGCVVADAGYGLSAPSRQGLTARNLAWAVGIPRHLKVYPLGVQMIWPVAKRGRPRLTEAIG
jgi:SRSO17 transposase